MDSVLDLPGSKLSKKLVRKAGAIPDPVAKLQYLRHTIEQVPVRAERRRRSAYYGLVLCGALLLAGQSGHLSAKRGWMVESPARSLNLTVRPHKAVSKVWLVEQTGQTEVYSNGLRIDNRMASRGKPRSYRVVDRDTLEFSEPRTEPAGIVFHTTESQLAPFEETHNAHLKRIGGDVLSYVRRHSAYHFLIDRFGGVHRVVAETDAANHAGVSVWGEGQSVYVYLNQSFLGISIEAESERAEVATPAQIHSAAVLTEMLRSKYAIPVSMCVTHAQVSLNAQAMLIGHHTDWASAFPFAGVGLPDQYDAPLASVTVFGFRWEQSFIRAVGGKVWSGLVKSEEQLLRDSARAGLAPEIYRRRLQSRFRSIAAELAKDTGTRSEDTGSQDSTTPGHGSSPRPVAHR
ncbi:MAG: N-acetylmuramoyl-L-alanine amidase [Bryobacteraceae bacterium]